jgi:hypothetical protein
LVADYNEKRGEKKVIGSIFTGGTKQIIQPAMAFQPITRAL